MTYHACPCVYSCLLPVCLCDLRQCLLESMDFERQIDSFAFQSILQCIDNEMCGRFHMNCLGFQLQLRCAEDGISNAVRIDLQLQLRNDLHVQCHTNTDIIYPHNGHIKGTLTKMLFRHGVSVVIMDFDIWPSFVDSNRLLMIRANTGLSLHSSVT